MDFSVDEALENSDDARRILLLRQMLTARRSGKYDPNQDQDKLVESLQCEKYREIRFYLWSVLMWSRPNETLKNIALADLHASNAEVAGRACAMAYLVNRFPDIAIAHVKNTPEEAGEYMQIERAKAWYLIDKPKAIQMLLALLHDADHGVTETIEDLLADFEPTART